MTNTIFSFGNYSRWDDFEYTHFRDENSRILLKIDKGFIYFIVLKDLSKIYFIIKVCDHFAKNTMFLSDTRLNIEFDNDKTNKIIDIFEENYNNQYNNKEKKKKDKEEENKKSENLEYKEEKLEIENLEKEGEENKKIEICEIYLKEFKIYQIGN